MTLPRVIRFLLALNVIAYLLCAIVLWRIPATVRILETHFVLGISWWREPWQLVTYSLLHPASFFGLLHFAFGLFWLYWIGQDLEDLRGSAITLSLWCCCTIGGGMITMLITLALELETPAFMGMWGPLIGMMVAVCAWNPDRRIRLFALGSFRLLYVVAVLLFLDLLRPASGLVSVGGAAFGWLFVWLDKQGVDLSSWANRLLQVPSRFKASLRGGPEESMEELERAVEPFQDTPAYDEVDRILDKINAEGMDALTDSERRVLEEASRR